MLRPAEKAFIVFWQDEQGFRSELLAIQGPRLQGHNFASVFFFLVQI